MVARVTWLTSESISLEKLHFRTFPLTCRPWTRSVTGSVPLAHGTAAVPGGKATQAAAVGLAPRLHNVKLRIAFLCTFRFFPQELLPASCKLLYITQI